MCERCKHDSGFIKGAMLGALIGGVLSLLYAPKSGEETRKHLKRKGQEALRLGQEKVDELNEQIEDRVDEILEQIEDAAGPLKEKAIQKLEMLADEIDSTKKVAKKVSKRLFKNTNLS